MSYSLLVPRQTALWHSLLKSARINRLFQATGRLQNLEHFNPIEIMEVQALTKYVLISPKKAREVTREIQGRRAGEAVQLLKFIPRKAARLVGRTLHSAIANAENNNNLASDQLIISKAVIEEGPSLKRFRAGARGSAKPYKKRTSHIRIVLSDNE